MPENSLQRDVLIKGSENVGSPDSGIDINFTHLPTSCFNLVLVVRGQPRAGGGRHPTM